MGNSTSCPSTACSCPSGGTMDIVSTPPCGEPKIHTLGLRKMTPRSGRRRPARRNAPSLGLAAPALEEQPRCNPQLKSKCGPRSARGRPQALARQVLTAARARSQRGCSQARKGAHGRSQARYGAHARRRLASPARGRPCQRRPLTSQPRSHAGRTKGARQNRIHKNPRRIHVDPVGNASEPMRIHKNPRRSHERSLRNRARARESAPQGAQRHADPDVCPEGTQTSLRQPARPSDLQQPRLGIARGRGPPQGAGPWGREKAQWPPTRPARQRPAARCPHSQQGRHPPRTGPHGEPCAYTRKGCVYVRARACACVRARACARLREHARA